MFQLLQDLDKYLPSDLQLTADDLALAGISASSTITTGSDEHLDCKDIKPPPPYSWSAQASSLPSNSGSPNNHLLLRDLDYISIDCLPRLTSSPEVTLYEPQRPSVAPMQIKEEFTCPLMSAVPPTIQIDQCLSSTSSPADPSSMRRTPPRETTRDWAAVTSPCVIWYSSQQQMSPSCRRDVTTTAHEMTSLQLPPTCCELQRKTERWLVRPDAVAESAEPLLALPAPAAVALAAHLGRHLPSAAAAAAHVTATSLSHRPVRVRQSCCNVSGLSPTATAAELLSVRFGPDGVQLFLARCAAPDLLPPGHLLVPARFSAVPAPLLDVLSNGAASASPVKRGPSAVLPEN